MKSFFNTRKPRQFVHHPIYWDPRKEELEKREKRIDSELKSEEEDYAPKYIKRGIFINSSSHIGKKKYGTRQLLFKNTVLSVLIALLSALIYFIYFK